MPTAIALGKSLRRPADQIGIAHRGRAEDDPRDLARQPALDRRHVADAAAELDRHLGRGKDRLDGGAVDRAAGEGAVQVDHMQPREAGFGETARLRRRVGVEHGRPRHVARLEAHALRRPSGRWPGRGSSGRHGLPKRRRHARLLRSPRAVTPAKAGAHCSRARAGETGRAMDPGFRRDDGWRWSEGGRAHGAHSRKFSISFSPSFWLFSGWNWVPAMVSRATIAVTGPP